MKRTICILMSLILCLALLSPAVYAASDSSRSYNFELTVDGSSRAAVSVGDEITLEVKLNRTDVGKSGSYAMYAIQDEIVYDSSYFSLVESSKKVTDGYDFNVVTMDDGIRKRIILSRISYSPDGIEIDDSVIIATFKLKTLQPGKDVSIRSKDFKVNADTYITTSNDVSVTIFGPCTVSFNSNDGSIIESQTVKIGGKVTKPDNPVKNEYTFNGWYSDEELSIPWNFATDCVSGNMTLYAKWTPITPSTYAVTFRGGPDATGNAPTMGNKAYGESFTLPANTFTKTGYTFAGWNDGTNSYAAGSSYIMPAHTVTFTAYWTESSSGGDIPGGGGGDVSGGSGAETVEIKVSGDAESISVPANIEESAATVIMDINDLGGILDERIDTGTVTMDFSTLKQRINTVTIPSESLEAINNAAQNEDNDVDGLKVILSTGEVKLDASALDSVSKAVGDSGLKIIVEEAVSLTDEQKTVVKNVPVYDIRVVTDDGNVIELNGRITVYLPYKLKEGQSGTGVVVYYVDGSGNLIDMKAKYDSAKRMAYFTTDHLSIYMIDYDESVVHVCPSKRYTDVDQSLWYHEAIDFVIENGLFLGTSDTTFEPNTAMNRAMLVTVLWRLEGKPVVSSSGTFEDVASNTWYTDAVTWANTNKIVEGYGSGLFGPNDNMTREQMAAILYRYAEFKGYDVTAIDNLTAFTDARDVSDWALSAIKWAVAEELITGVTTTSLDPRGNATRAQVATILMRLIVNVVN